VLRLANSAYFNRTLTKVENIEVAVIKLGIDGLRVVLSAAVMQPVIQRQSSHFPRFGQRLWEHTFTCALACEQIALLRGIEAYKAYLLGLIHEVGRITLFNELGKQFQQQGGSEIASAAVLIPLLDEQSYSFSAAIAVDWDLPKEIVVALQQQIDLAPGRQVSALAQVLFQANLATEAYLIQRYSADAELELPKLAQELSLPSGFFADLDRLSNQV
jgi:HD-like signal output (HDOD) protein